MKRIRRYLVAGILVWAPLAVTYLLLRFAVNVMDRTLLLLPLKYRPDEVLGFHIPGLGVILAVVVLLLTGLLAANFVGRAFVGGWESLLDRIPVVRAIYSSLSMHYVLHGDNILQVMKFTKFFVRSLIPVMISALVTSSSLWE